MVSSHTRFLPVPATVLALVLTACTTTAAPVPTPAASTVLDEPGAMPTGTPIDVVTGLVAPWAVTFAEDTAIISERDSRRILEVLPDAQLREVGVVAGSAARGEGGLLGLAMRGTDLYVFSTGTDGGRIERYPLTGEPGRYALGAPQTIIDGLPAASYHNGGRIAFGPDGMLYASVGDAGNRDSAQDLQALSGKILRMTPDGDVPPDNPFTDSLVYSYGHRNVQGLAWAEDGRLFASEFGQDTWDELNIIEPGGNYGWPVAEGDGDNDEFVNPVQQWRPDASSPSGIAIVGGTVFVAGLRGEVLTAVPVSDPTTSTDLYAGEYGRLRDVAPAPDGTLWFITNNTDGRGTPAPDDDRVLSVQLD